MRWWLTTLTLTIAIAVSGIQASAQPLTVWWLSFVANGNAQVPIRINPATGLVDLVNGVFVDSRFPSLSADGRQVVFQVGNGAAAQIWQAVWDATNGRWQVNPVPIPQTDPPRPLIGFHPVISADGNHIAFASWQDYRPPNPDPNNPPFPDPPKSQIYVLDRLQNRIVPVSFLWQDTDGDGMRNTFVPSNGNCVPVAISADGRIVVFLAQSPNALNIVDADGDGTSDPVNNPPSDWFVLIHDRDADGNGVYDEVGIGATNTSIGNPLDSNGNYIPADSVSVSANGRIIAFATPNPTNPEQWHIFVRDWQSGTGDFIRDSNNNPVPAFAPALSDDGTYLAYLTPQLDNDNDGQFDEDPIDGVDNDNDGKIDEDPVEPPYPQTMMDLVVRQLADPRSGQPLAQIREVRLGNLLVDPTTRQRLQLQAGAMDGSAGWGYSDWWGAVTIAVDPTNLDVAYVAFHAWSTDLVDLSLVRSDLVVDGNANVPRLKFYQGVANIFLARFDFTNYDAAPQAPNRIRLWRLTEWTDQQQMNKWRGLPISLTVTAGQQPQYRLTLAPNLLPAISFVNPDPTDPRLWRLFVAFQSLAPFDQQNDINGLWDIYLADVLLP
jgi:Tol biopolymer transport system component